MHNRSKFALFASTALVAAAAAFALPASATSIGDYTDAVKNAGNPASMVMVVGVGGVGYLGSAVIGPDADNVKSSTGFNGAGKNCKDAGAPLGAFNPVCWFVSLSKR